MSDLFDAIARYLNEVGVTDPKDPLEFHRRVSLVRAVAKRAEEQWCKANDGVIQRSEASTTPSAGQTEDLPARFWPIIGGLFVGCKSAQEIQDRQQALRIVLNDVAWELEKGTAR